MSIIDPLIEQKFVELYTTYEKLNKGVNYNHAASLEFVVNIKYRIFWKEGTSGTVNREKFDFSDEVEEAYDSYVESDLDKFNKDIEVFINQCDDFAERLGMDKYDFWNALEDNDMSQLPHLLDPVVWENKNGDIIADNNVILHDADRTKSINTLIKEAYEKGRLKGFGEGYKKR